MGLHTHSLKDAHPLDHWTEVGSGGLRVYAYAAAELAVSLEISPLAALRLMSDAVDIQHRLPHTWAAVQELRLDDGVARKIASQTRDLSDHLAVTVDRQIAAHLGVLPPGRLFRVVEARVVEADQARADAKAERARAAHGLWLVRLESGSAGVVIKGDAADVARFYEMSDRIAQVLAESGEGDETMDQLRARAVGILADPRGAADFLDGRDPARGRTTLYGAHHSRAARLPEVRCRRRVPRRGHRAIHQGPAGPPPRPRARQHPPGARRRCHDPRRRLRGPADDGRGAAPHQAGRRLPLRDVAVPHARPRPHRPTTATRARRGRPGSTISAS